MYTKSFNHCVDALSKETLPFEEGTLMVKHIVDEALISEELFPFLLILFSTKSLILNNSKRAIRV